MRKLTFSPISFYRSLLLHKLAFPQTTFYTNQPLHKRAFTHTSFYTNQLFDPTAFTQTNFAPTNFYKAACNKSAFTHTSLYTNQLFDQPVFTQATFCLLHQPTFTSQLLHNSAFTHTSFCTNQLLHKPPFTQTTFCTNQLLQTSFYTIQLLITHTSFYTNQLLDNFRQATFYANHLLHQPALHNPCFGPWRPKARGPAECWRLLNIRTAGNGSHYFDGNMLLKFVFIPQKGPWWGLAHALLGRQRAMYDSMTQFLALRHEMFCACLTISGHTHWKKSRQKPRDTWKNSESVHFHWWVGKFSNFLKVHKHGQPTSEAWLMSCARGIGAKNVNQRRMITSFAGRLVAAGTSHSRASISTDPPVNVRVLCDAFCSLYTWHFRFTVKQKGPPGPV